MPTKTDTFKTLIALLFFLPSFLIASPKYSVGDKFKIIPYKDIEGVYLQIESINEHPFLDLYYEVSFHGVCFKDLRAPVTVTYEFGNAYLSEEALTGSISKTNRADLKDIFSCTELPEDDESKKELSRSSSVSNGMLGILLSPLTKSLSEFIISPERIITK